ncbi:MAG: Nif11-like leader peptide family RiPP precursor, partial [Campylobacterota bacterium]|nr:Nif11-like leader peptide family RiPP precursor [Campylobacterota bacterium]
METIKKFEEMLKADENLALEYQKLTEDKDSEAVVNFMKAYGVSDEDIKELINRELSDDELDGVAGG